MIWRWLKFNLVGGAGIVVQLAALWLLVHPLRVDVYLATAVAVEIAVLHNFFWHQRFTWADRKSVSLRQSALRLLRFNLTNGGLSILGNMAVMALLVGRFHLPPVPSNLAAIAVCSLANFLASHYFVWR